MVRLTGVKLLAVAIVVLVASAALTMLVANMSTHSRARCGLVFYLHYILLVRMTNKYDGTSVVLAEVPNLARALFQRFPTFWTISHLQIPS